MLCAVTFSHCFGILLSKAGATGRLVLGRAEIFFLCADSFATVPAQETRRGVPVAAFRSLAPHHPSTAAEAQGGGAFPSGDLMLRPERRLHHCCEVSNEVLGPICPTGASGSTAQSRSMTAYDSTVAADEVILPRYDESRRLSQPLERHDLVPLLHDAGMVLCCMRLSD